MRRLPGPTPHGRQTSGMAALTGLCGALATAAVAGALARSLARGWEELPGGGIAGASAPVPVGTALELVLTAASVLLAGWLAGLLLVAAALVAPGRHRSLGRRMALRASPHWAPRVGALLLAVTLGAPTAALAAAPGTAPAPAVPLGGPATAGPGTAGPGTVPHRSPSPGARPDALPGDASRRESRAEPEEDIPVPGWRPTTAPARPATGEVALLSRGTEPVDTVVVRCGDSLWSIAASHLGPEATVEQVAREWPRWYAANRAVIGADPDLIRPGQELRPPTAAAPASGGVAP